MNKEIYKKIINLQIKSRTTSRPLNFSGYTAVIFFLVASFLLSPFSPLLFPSVFAEVMSSSNFKIESDSVNFGGGRSTSTSYTMEDTVGEIATGISSSTNFVLKAGYQQMHDVYISTTQAADVTMSPAIGGVSGGTSNGSTVFTVATDSQAGYTVTIVASSSPALRTATDSFADYVPGGANPDFTFTNAATASSFAFSPEGGDIDQKYRDNGASCSTGSGDVGSACWDGLSTSPKTIVNRTSANHPTGTATTIRFRAASGSSHVQENGTYVATTTVTIMPL